LPARIRIPSGIAKLIRAVQPSIVREVQDHLVLLRTKPKLGTPILTGDFEGLRAYEFRVDRLPLSRRFTLLYAYGDQGDELDVVEFGIFEGIPAELHPPTFRVDRPAAP
jgi:hypothetical protein